jgi:biotin carboxylase
MPGKVGVLHHPRSFFAPDLKDRIGNVAELVWVLVDGDWDDSRARRLLKKFGSVVEIPSSDLETAAGSLRDHDVQGVVTFVDDHLVLAAELAQRLGTPYHSPAVAHTIMNKRRQRETLAAAGVPGPRYWSLPPDLSSDAVRDIASAAHYPAVLKPAYGSGSRGIMRISNGEDLLRNHALGVDQLLEEHLEDDPNCDRRFASYLSVESAVSRGQVTHVAITGRFPLAQPYRETGNFIPASVDDETRESVVALAGSAILALHISDAVVHSEIKLTPNGPRLIELNGRLGGRPPFVLETVSEVNLFQVTCQIALGESISVETLATCGGVGFWRMLQPPASAVQVRSASGVAELLSLASIDQAILNHGPGSPINVAEGTDSATVTVRGRVDDLDQLAATIDMIDRAVQIEYEYGDATEAVTTVLDPQ